jgi:hypothetical protein
MGGMKCRMKPFKIGDVVTVNHCYGGYGLPNGLTDGEAVTIGAIDIGTVRVWTEHGAFSVPLACVNSGLEYELLGKWYDEKHPKIIQALANWRSSTTLPL